MKQKILFLDSSSERLVKASQETTEPFSGLFIGLKDSKSHLILGYYSFEQAGPKFFVKQFEAAFNLLPLGYQVLGYFFKSPQSHIPNVVRNLCKKIFPAGSAQQKCMVLKDCTTHLLIGVLDEGSEPTVNLHWFDSRNQILSPSFKPDAATEEETRKICNRFVLCHIRATLPFSFHDTDNSDDRKASVEMHMSALAHSIDRSLVCYRVGQSGSFSSIGLSLLLQGKDDSKVRKIRNHFDLGKFGSNGKGADSGKNRSQILFHDFLTFDLLTKMTGMSSSENGLGILSCVPVLHHDHMEYTLVNMDLPLDVLLLLNLGEEDMDPCAEGEGDNDDDDDDDEDENHVDVFSEAIRRQLRDFSNFIINSGKDSDWKVPRPHHFSVPDTNLIITCIYSDGADEKDLAPVRKELHGRFLVPTTSPTFRKFNKLRLHRRTVRESEYPLDVHLGLPNSKAKGKVSLIKGSYQYRHYMQDRTDDSGWGCAYRSLQTIASWLMLQGFADRTPPSHVEIQKALVDVGDKPSSFLNSRQWIGSTEVSYVLDHLYNVQSKISHVSSGDEMMSKAREIARHFEMQGTPIMIGGGALAHTIIGIDFNDDTGDVCYLVLDPHYTGLEDIKVIQNKGWCGWKGPEFWKAGSFYNMCMPIKPTEF